jgi:hypothetical protein
LRLLPHCQVHGASITAGLGHREKPQRAKINAFKRALDGLPDHYKTGEREGRLWVWRA